MAEAGGVDYNNLDYSRYREWPQITTPSGGVYYQIPGTPYVYDPFLSSAKGRPVLFRNPQPGLDAEKAKQDLIKKQMSVGNQVLPIVAGTGGTLAAMYGAKHLIGSSAPPQIAPIGNGQVAVAQADGSVKIISGATPGTGEGVGGGFGGMELAPGTNAAGQSVGPGAIGTTGLQAGMAISPNGIPFTPNLMTQNPMLGSVAVAATPIVGQMLAKKFMPHDTDQIQRQVNDQDFIRDNVLGQSFAGFDSLSNDQKLLVGKTLMEAGKKGKMSDPLVSGRQSKSTGDVTSFNYNDPLINVLAARGFNNQQMADARAMSPIERFNKYGHLLNPEAKAALGGAYDQVAQIIPAQTQVRSNPGPQSSGWGFDPNAVMHKPNGAPAATQSSSRGGAIVNESPPPDNQGTSKGGARGPAPLKNSVQKANIKATDTGKALAQRMNGRR